MEIEKIECKIKEYISSNILFNQNGFAYDNDTSFVKAGILDSTGILEIVVFIEETYNITIPDHDITTDNLDSVTKVANYVHCKLSKNNL